MKRPNNNGSRIPRDREENVQAILFDPDAIQFRVGLIATRQSFEVVIRPRPAGAIIRLNLEREARRLRAEARRRFG